MRLLTRSQLRFLLRYRWSTVTVLLGLSLGVASVVAVHLISVRVADMLAATTPPHLAGITHLLQRSSGPTTAEDYFSLRSRWRHGELDPRIRGMLPVVEGQLVVDGRRVIVFGADWLAAPSVRQESLGSPGLLMADAVIADERLGVAAGERLLIGGRYHRVARVVTAGVDPALFVDIGTAQSLLGTPADVVSYVAVVWADPLDEALRVAEAAMPGISAGMDWRMKAWQLPGWTVRPISAELPGAAFARSVIFNVGALGSLSLLVAWFLVYQVAVIWNRRRRLLTDRLLAMGVTRGELTRSFVAGFVLLGLVATVMGVVAGAALARVLSAVSSAGMAVGGGYAELSGWVLFKALLSGVVVAGLAAWMACRRNATSWSGRSRWLVAAILLLGVAVGVGVPASGVVGGFVAVLAMSVLVAAAVRPLLETLRRRGFGGFGTLLTRAVLREIVWYPRDLSIAVAALCVAIATSMGVGMMVESFRHDFSLMLDRRLAHDLFIDGAGRDLRAVAAWLGARPEVAGVQRYGRARMHLDGHAVELGFTDFDDDEAARYGMAQSLSGGEAIVSEQLARRLGLATGDRLAVGDGLRVVGVFRGYGDAGLRMLVDDVAAAALGVPLVYDRLSVTVASASAAAVTDLERQLAAAFPVLQVQARGARRALALDIFDRTFAITRALTLLAMLVAVIGMYNALLALRLNQATTIRLLTALGAQRFERRRLALKRSMAVGALAVVFALPLGIALAWLLCAVINPRAFGWSFDLQLNLRDIVAPSVLGLLAALLAGALAIPAEAEEAFHEA